MPAIDAILVYSKEDVRQLTEFSKQFKVWIRIRTCIFHYESLRSISSLKPSIKWSSNNRIGRMV
jgi:hypothetical protein